jgi:ABC-type lipoprotein release transport system permease subunit
MNPLSVWTFYRRHKRRAFLLLSLSILVTAGIYLMEALLWGVYMEPGRSSFMFLSKFSVVTPESQEEGPDPAVIARIRANSDVAQIVPTSLIWITLPGLMGGEGSGFYLLGLMEEDMPYILERCGATLKEGQLPGPRTNGLLFSEKVAASLDLQVGDTIHKSIDSERYGNIVTPLEVVGILESDVRLGIVSLEFLNNHEFHGRSSSQFLVVARENRDAAVDDFLRSEIHTTRTNVHTFQKFNERLMTEYLDSLVMVVPVVIIVTIAFALVIVVVNWIAFSRRLPELGISHAIGLSRKWLIRRLTMETATLASVGWAMGIGLSWLILYILKVTLFAPRGHDLSVFYLSAMGFTIPLPAAVGGFTLISVRRLLSRLDPVDILERGERSQEGDQKRGTTASVSSRVNTSSRVNISSPRSLASATFYRRHKRRAVLLISAMSLMIVAVVLSIFILAVSFDAQEPGQRYLSRMSIVRSSGIIDGLDPGIVARVRTHPAVERVIPVAPRYHMLGVSIPPFVDAEASPFGVYADDMVYLVELYGLELKEGHLPRPRTNEMVIPEILAQNRDLQIGDVIGDPDHPAYPGAEALPSEFVVSGIFARASAPKDENWLGFVSLEFLESYDVYHVPDVPSLIVVPKEGQKDALDNWLENELAGGGVSVLTYRQEVDRIRESARSQMLVVALLESIIAIVAAIALAVLNYIFVSQRQSEFGVLHALGYGRLRLVWRTVRETFFTTGLAWGISAVLFLIGLVYLQFGLFAPLGLRLNFFNLTPWLFTLPIPVAVLFVSAGTMARTLSKLDPVSIIERR